MKRIIIITLLLFICCNSQAQPNNGDRPQQEWPQQRRLDRIHAIKVGYLTDRLKLTSDQSASFWPVYNRYEQEQRALRRSFIQKYQNGASSDEEGQSRQFVEDNLDYQTQELALKKHYKEEFLQIISVQQLATLYSAERDFKKLLLQQLRNHQRD